LIALAYDHKNEPHRAARYYKSYLDKLKTFQAGEYPISAPVIATIDSGMGDQYDIAYNFIVFHLQTQGIQLDSVEPAFFFPVVLKQIFLLIFFCILYVLIRKHVWPYVQKQQKLLDLEEGSWLCDHCGHNNWDISKVCTECGTPRTSD